MSSIVTHRHGALLIGAKALVHDLVLVTGNSRHFTWMHGLRIDDWRSP
ncbi:MAG TPA: hypothetical protein VND64_32735 [Pirellulales bacterium]|nr:hypothetical protein [Pirellulales bacterium]